MSKIEIENKIKEIVSQKTEISQDDLAKELASLRYISLREGYSVMRNMIDNRVIKANHQDSGKYTLYA